MVTGWDPPASGMSVKQVIHDFSSWPLEHNPPCDHNVWVKVAPQSGTVAFLQCRVCLSRWKADLSVTEKCTRYTAGSCNSKTCTRVHLFTGEKKVLDAASLPSPTIPIALPVARPVSLEAGQ
eukprot:Sspe_Gene.116662::Locus_106323_Transcript_1_1_Confidence_1.000_Length_365::g.116662::m.116662